MERMDAAGYIERFKTDYYFRLSPKAISGYQLAVKQLQEHVKKSCDAITKKDIRTWLMYLQEKGYQPTSINNKLIGLRTFYNYCVEEGIVPSNPASKIPLAKIDEKTPIYLTKNQLTSLRKSVEGTLSERAVIETLYATGIRISELVDMKKEDINWSERSILIPEGKWKKGRIVLFHHECLEHLRTYLDGRMDSLPYVFVNERATGKIRPQVVYSNFRIYSDHLGLKITPHSMRHTFAAHLAEKGMPLEGIQQLLGHDSPHTTQLYARLFDQVRRNMYEKWM